MAARLGLVVAACFFLKTDGTEGGYPPLRALHGTDTDMRQRREKALPWNQSDGTPPLSAGEGNGTAAGAPSLESQRRALQGLNWRWPAAWAASEGERVLQEEKPGYNGSVVSAEGFPALEESTVMFLHVFKCAGSTLRRMLVSWAEAEEQHGAIVRSCNQTAEEGEVCLMNYHLVDKQVQTEIMSRQKVLAGHFIWGFQHYLKKPYLMVTALRNPLEIFVSGQQYKHKRKTRTLEEASAYISRAMKWALEELEEYGNGSVSGGDVLGSTEPKQFGGFVFRFVGQSKNRLTGEELELAADEAMRNLDTFWLVGVVEQYAGFEEVLKRLLDPEMRHDDVWQLYSTHQFNTSPVSASKTLAALDPELVRRFNGSLALQWKVYEKAVALWDGRCREALPATMHDEMCTVALPSSPYGS